MKKSIVLLFILVLVLSSCSVRKSDARTSDPSEIHNETSSLPEGDSDKTSGWQGLNVMLTRPDNWEKIIENPVVSYEDLQLIDGSTATIPITAELFRQFYDVTDEKLRQYIDGLSGPFYHSTTHNAYVNLIVTKNNELTSSLEDYRGKPSNLILVTPPSDEEKQLAKDKGVELDLTPVAKDGFVFITHRNNPVESLTIEQIQDIYTGKITNWNQVGGENLEIKAYQREQNSGSQTAMEQIVMQGKQMMPSINTMAHDMAGLVEAVAEYENGNASIGYTYYYYINNLYKNDNIKVININGTAPVNENLLSGAYPFTTSYYAVIRGGEPQNSAARKLRDFLVSSKGQELIAMAGYCKAVN